MAKRTSTRAFGTSNRIGHDTSDFYDRKVFSGNSESDKEKQSEQCLPKDRLNQIYCHTSKSMTELPDRSVHLVVTSPPFNVGKEYDDDLSINEYEELPSNVFSECQRVLIDGGRVCVNVANVGRKPYIPLNAMVSMLMMRLGYLMRGEIIWNKGASAGVSCAWGSWLSPSNPVLRDVHEYILVLSKASYRRSARQKATIDKEGFLDWTKSIWNFPAESARKVGHPAPFPIELPRRLIELYTYRDDIVLDPFMGAGSTSLASLKTDRKVGGLRNVNRVLRSDSQTHRRVTCQ